MKKIFTILLLMPLLWACTSDKEEIIQDKTKEYIVSLGFVGEITDIIESPLTRTGSNDLYGIQVYSSSHEDNDLKPYAYGLFSDINGVTIKLIEGYKYTFVSTMVIDGINKVKHNSENKYGTPFSFNSSFTTPITNYFTYDESRELKNLSKGGATIDSSLDKASPKVYERPNLDRYYGRYNNFIPSESTNVSIDMKRKSFGIKVIAENITDGKLVISMPGSPKMIIEYPNTIVEEIFSFSDLTRTFYDSEESNIHIEWIDSKGLTNILANRPLVINRNKKITIHLNIGDGTTNSGVIINKESGEFIGEEEIIIKGTTPDDTDVLSKKTKQTKSL